ncbi:hypothetical protein SLS53_001610 [Cytospora paraplurivora]|uniref:Uncharacterized protein n=1 Tax=Cytospora paraplurivora TaxID=2898453 RepID=A0AAN9UGC6_9PEZI
MAVPTKLSLKIPLSRPEFLHYKRGRHSRLASTPEEVENVELDGQQCRITTQEAATQMAKEWIESMIRSEGRWDNHLSIIRIDCPYTTAELLGLGRLAQQEGVKQCRKMVRAPVIYDEIGYFLWEKLAEMERGPNFREQDEEKAAEYAREMGARVTLANLDDRFRFDVPKGKDRGRQDSDPISPTEVQHQQQRPRDENHQRQGPQRRPSHHHNQASCHFCGTESICERVEVLEEIRNEALNATRGRVVSKKRQEPGEKAQPQPTTNPTPVAPMNTAITTHARPAGPSRSSSHASTLLWQREYASSSMASSGTGPRSSSGPRSSTLSDKVVQAVGSLSRSVGSHLGHGLANGYGYGGSRRDRNGSVWTI